MRLKFLVPLGQVQERWRHDRQEFLAKAKALGVEVTLQATSFVIHSQNQQAEKALLEGVDVLAVIASTTISPAPIIEFARKTGVPVIAYDRLVNDCGLDLYISFDNVKVGEMQARYLIQRKPRGKYLLIGGPKEDSNTPFFRQGQMGALGPYIDAGEIKLVAEQAAKDWLPDEACRITKEALDKSGQLDAVLASNDGLAEGAIQALKEAGLAGNCLVTGQDAELTACQRIVEGTQSMTVYKPIKLLAATAVEMALALWKKQNLGGMTTTVSNGRMPVPSVLLPPVLVDKANLESVVIADGFQKKSDIYRKVS
jgi:D-xylose transport system substrate-binding protein